MTPESTTSPVTSPGSTKPEPVNPPVVADNIVPKKIKILGVPLDLGQSRRGVDMGPSAVRVAGLEARLEELG
ncbi:MAG TPA: arginase family protein, partial [Candidatus Angelobacter sp.]|nr:arginase family protein [Candidatus Angelobacter sp.]